MSPRTTAAWLAIATSILLAPNRVAGWGFDVHRFIVNRAIDLLPEPIRPFYDHHRTFIVEHSIDPDLWRTAGFGDEAPRHFLNLDAYGESPFAELPRSWTAAVEKFGEARVTRSGLLPWRTVEFYGRLVEAFTRQQRSGGSRELGNIMFFSAVLSHYVGDAHVPFHAVLNYDGQLTDQRGIHARFETELFRRYHTGLTIQAARGASEADGPLALVFDALQESVRVTPLILDADRRAVAGRTEYDAEYFNRFAGEVQPILEARLDASIAAVAGLLADAWTAGGRPALSVDPPRFNRRVSGRPR